jgi:hypothetical protein
MLHCTRKIAAMQTRSLFWHLVYIKSLSTHRDAIAVPHNLRVKMSETATIALPASGTLFGRLLVKLDRFLMAWAEANIRNGDVPRFGL